MQIQQPNIVGNFLNAYQSGLERQEAQKEAERQRMRQDRADQRSDQQFQWQMDDRQLQEAMRRKEMLARAAMALDTPEKWTAGAPQVMRELGMDGEVPGFDQRDRIISESMTIGEQLEQQWKERGYKLDELRTNAQVRASNANAAQSYAAAAASMRGGGEGIDNKTFDNISNLRKEYVAGTKDFSTVRDAYGRIKATGNSATPAGDIAMIYSYMKMLDPGSVVREAEFSTAQNAKPLLDRLGISWDSVKAAWQGNRLQPSVRADFMNQADNIFRQQKSQYDVTRKTYTDLSQRFGFSPDLVVTDQTGGLAVEQAPQPGAPQRFTGSGLLGGPGIDYALPERAGTSGLNSQPSGKTSGWSVKKVGN